MTIITMENISHQYQNNWALRHVSFKVNHGGKVALLGASGSGKTTLLRLIAGIETPAQGRILYDDQPLIDIPAFERNIGMVFQNYALIPHWESQRTIGFFLSLRKRETEVPERIRRVSAITGVGIDQLLKRRPDKMSGGEQQKVAIARAFTRDLKVLLLDEPFANLDAKIRATARFELQKLMNEFPITTVMVTHDQHEAAAISDGIVLLRDGKIEQFGEYDYLRNDPDTLYVAQFIGVTPINVFHGQVRTGKWHHHIIGDYPLPSAISDGTPIDLAIRPEDVLLQSGGIRASIKSITPYYGQKMQILEVAQDDTVWQIQVSSDTRYEKDETLECALNPDKLFFFESDTGKRIR
jgi:putative spermidine/putrescine transport system ATP-binding protein